jgi:hypothetical protein
MTKSGGIKFTAGPKNPGAKLTWDVVRKMRDDYSRGVSQGKLAVRYRVSVNTVGRIVRNESWQEGTRPLTRKVGTEEKTKEEILEGLLRTQREVNLVNESRNFAVKQLSPEAAERVKAVGGVIPPLEEIMRREAEESQARDEELAKRLGDNPPLAGDGGLEELMKK